MIEKTPCRTPAEGREGVTNIPTWKFDLCRRAILHAVEAAGPDGLLFRDLASAVRDRLSQTDLARLGSIGWHVTTVKLELEVAGQLERLETNGPQRIRVLPQHA